jgi:microcystin-dependent protein
MTTVTGFTAARTQAIEDAEIVSGAPDASGNLILNKAGGGSINVGSIVAPSGSVVMTAAIVVPTGWLLCNGQTISRTTYAALFTAIGTAYGAGDGSTTFQVPNLEAKFPRMQAASRGGTGGGASHTHSGPSHTHSETSHDRDLAGGSPAAHARVALVGTSGNTLFMKRIGAASWTSNYRATTTLTEGSTTPETDATEVGGHTANGTGTTTGAGGTAATGSTVADVPPYVNLNFIIKI